MTLEKTLLNQKLNDFEKYSAAMPLKAKLLSKSFANAIGQSSGKVLLAYDSMLKNIMNNSPTSKTVSECSKIVDKESKVKFMKFDARLCSLVALNYSGFMDAETMLYTELINDMKGKDVTIDSINYELRSLGTSNPEKYEKLLSNKMQSIYDFGVLMGTNDDKERFNVLTDQMHGTLAKYFTNVVKLHQGNKFFSWPIPFRNYSGVISDMLYHDSTSFALQDSIGKDMKFQNPTVHDSKYTLILDEINNVFKKRTFKNKWQTARTLPAYASYIFGLSAYASDISDKTDKTPDYLGAAATAGLIASTIAGNDKDDRSEFVTTFLTLFTTTLG